MYQNNNTTDEIRNIDMVSLVQSHGVQLKKRGSRYVGLCPFHTEKTGSFFVFPDNRFHCFGCLATGDSATFIMKSINCSFPEALERLGIKRTNKHYVQAEIKKFKENEIKNSLVKTFRAWEARYSSKLGGLITSGHRRISKIKTNDDLVQTAWIYPFLLQWQYHLDILCYGTDQDKYKLFQEVR